MKKNEKMIHKLMKKKLAYRRFIRCYQDKIKLIDNELLLLGVE